MDQRWSCDRVDAEEEPWIILFSREGKAWEVGIIKFEV